MENVINNTVKAFAKLCWLRGVSAEIEWKEDKEKPHGGSYFANGTDCGPSVHGLYDWLKKQPGVLP